jgi:hypothetical protein
MFSLSCNVDPLRSILIGSRYGLGIDGKKKKLLILILDGKSFIFSYELEARAKRHPASENSRKERKMKAFLKKILVGYLVLAMFMIGITPCVFAGMSPSEIIALSQGAQTADLQKIQKFLELKIIQERLQAFGFTADEIQARLNQIDAGQIHEIALRLDNLKVGGDGGEVVIILLLVAILVVVVLYAMGHRIIIK